ncbi:hypothetical protein C8D89_10282 [Actinomycetospora cinnamomea]|uniref:Uncharacterized protein n=1 Tax=Actinomycetospora cinnamomea TaxID=663609 RepID=A0A2U1FL75_9PSEU|nr:hypothetical protein C8D89_10282 [Actinomycetospora cinnamomea]
MVGVALPPRRPSDRPCPRGALVSTLDHRRARARLDAETIDRAAAVLRRRVAMGRYAGLAGDYAGFEVCALLEAVAHTSAEDPRSSRVRDAALRVARAVLADEPGSP